MNRGLFILLIAILVFVPLGTAQADDTAIDYAVNNNNEIRLDENGNGTLEITFQGDSNNYFSGVQITIRSDSNIELGNITFEPSISSATIMQPRQSPTDQNSWTYGAYSVTNDNIIGADIKCTLDIQYTGDKNAEPTIVVTEVKLIRPGVGNNNEVKNTTHKTMKVIPSGGGTDPTEEEYNIEVINPTHGTITSPTAGAYKVGSHISLNINVASGYKLSEWQVTNPSGQEITLDAAVDQTSNGFTMPAEDVTVTAVVDEDDGKSLLRITVPSSDTGTVYLTIGNGSEIEITSENRQQRIAPEETVKIRFRANNRTFSQWSVGGISPALSLSERQKNPLTFDMPDKTVSISVSTTTPQGTTNSTTTTGGTSTTGSTTVGNSQTPLAEGQRFSDVPPAHWAYGFVNYLAEKGYVNGKSALIFAPADNITRAEFITILARMSGDTLPAYAGSFTDVAADAYYAQAVAWGVANDITTGTSATTFSPNSLITRQQIAAMLLRYANNKSFSFATPNTAASFTDQAQISAYAQAAVSTMQQAGIINGYDDGSFGPNRNATRAESSKMLALVHFLMANTDKTINDF